MFGIDKLKCIELVEAANIEIPAAYKMGFRNNNCLLTGCTQGGFGYWQKMYKEEPNKYAEMAKVEHELSELRGVPVTMLKDQSKAAKASGKSLVFLLPNPKFPEYKSLKDMPDCKVEPLLECNGFCGTNDLNPRPATDGQINFEF